MDSSINRNDLLVETPQGLTELCAQLASSAWIAVDTEFIRERTYYPRLCLLQVATPTLVACVDPLALPSLEPLLDVIHDRRVTKVLHAAYQDLEIFYQLRGEPLEPVFDTQMAASLLGLGEQIGYANLVRQILDIQLTKALSRSDWCARPLNPAQLRYAADDVRYLDIVYPRLQKLLNDKGRLDWLLSDSRRLYDASNYQSDAQEAWRRIAGVQQLTPRQLSVIRALAAWREREAARRDLPRKWVLTDAALVDLARLAPADKSALGRVRAVPKNQGERYGAAVITIIDTALKEPPLWPTPPARLILTPSQEAAVDMLMALVRSQAAKHEVSPAAIATRNTLERLVLGDTEVPVLHGWRARIVGNLLKTMLEGELRVGVQQGELQIEKRR